MSYRPKRSPPELGRRSPATHVRGDESSEFPTPDAPAKRMRRLGENLVMFRDTRGRMGALAEACLHAADFRQICGGLAKGRRWRVEAARGYLE
jgi:hypothetical protein